MYRKKAIPEATRRAVALRYGCEPGGILLGVRCHWCPATGAVYWHRTSSGRPSGWVSFPGLELDHLLPEALGGTADPSNIVLACRHCNRSRGSRRPHDILTEDVVSDSRPPHYRKGREGKGRGSEGGTEGPIHRLGSRGERAASMDGRSAVLGGGR